MRKRIIVKELSVNGHETHSIPLEKLPAFMRTKLDNYHVAFVEPMNKIIESAYDIEYLLEKITEVLIIPKIRGG